MLTSSIITPLLLSLAANAAPNRRTYHTNGGCGKAIPSDVELGVSANHQIDSKSTGPTTQRDYRLHVPESYDKDVAVPLIFSFHGRTRTAEYQESISQFSNSSFGFEGISVYPQGLKSTKGSEQWQGDPESIGVNDVEFTLELLDELSDTYCIDPSRVYATGMSNGGGFTALLACDPIATRKIAAFAPVSAAIYLNNKTAELDPCRPSRHVVPIMEFHGWEDGQIPYNRTQLNTRSNGYSVGIQKWLKGWAVRDGFDKNEPKITYHCSAAKNVTRYSWDETVIHYNVSNYNHNWPRTYGTEATQRTTCEDTEATRVILDWFAKWSL